MNKWYNFVAIVSTRQVIDDDTSTTWLLGNQVTKECNLKEIDKNVISKK